MGALESNEKESRDLIALALKNLDEGDYQTAAWLLEGAVTHALAAHRWQQRPTEKAS